MTKEEFYKVGGSMARAVVWSEKVIDVLGSLVWMPFIFMFCLYQRVKEFLIA